MVGGGLGYGQTWQDMNAVRTPGGSYTNNTGKPIMVSASFWGPSGASGAYAIVDGVTLNGSTTNSGYTVSVVFVVPPGSTYLASANYTSSYWWRELR